MYTFGQPLSDDIHFYHHIEHEVPVQVYHSGVHADIGFIQSYTDHYIKMNETYYKRTLYVFVSRPGY